MRVYLGADHRGFELKEEIKQWLNDNDFEVEDTGNFEFNPDDDYIDYAMKVGESIEGNEQNDRGILVCASGHGMEIVANKFPRVRAILGFNDQVTLQGRQDEDANVLVLPAEWVENDEATERVRLFLETEKSDETRHVRRRGRIENLKIR